MNKFQKQLDNFYNQLNEGGGSAFKSEEDAKEYCRLVKKFGVKCKPKHLYSNYWQAPPTEKVEDMTTPVNESTIHHSVYIGLLAMLLLSAKEAYAGNAKTSTKKPVITSKSVPLNVKATQKMQPSELDTKIEQLIPILIQVESNGNDKAIGDKGKAKGALQIWDVVVQDVNRIYKTNFVHDDAFDRKKAIQICKLYLKYYGNNYQKKTGKAPTLEVLARMWNGGGITGHKNDKTIAYWGKVKKLLGVA